MADQDHEATRSFTLSLPQRGSPTCQQLAIGLPASLYLPRLLEQTGLAGFEPSTLACWLTILSMSDHGAAMDVGANVGPYAWLAAAFSDRHVVAFEPVPDLAGAIGDVARRNDLPITVERTALSDRDGQAVLYLSDATDSSHSLVAGFRPSSNTIDVPTLALDSYVATTATAPHVMKIDTETSEPQVLAGAIRTIHTFRPWLIVEVLAGRTEQQLMKLLGPLHYLWFPIGDDLPFMAATEIVGDRTYMNTNWMFSPSKPHSSFWMELARWREALRSCIPGAYN